jgi:tRNA(Ile)-lysidine synthetase-like protein
VAGSLGTHLGRAGTHAAVAFITTGSSGGAVELAGNVRLERHLERFLIRRADNRPQDQPLRIAEPGNGQGTAVIGGRSYRMQWATRMATEPAAAASFSLGALRFPLEFRAWQPGDRIRLEAGTKKLKKLFLEKRIPRHERQVRPVLAGPGGTVFWIMGLARATRAEPEPGAQVFQFRVLDEHSS